MTVAEMLARIDAREISEWMAFERATGPLGNRYSEDMLANIHEQAQLTNHILGEANSDKDEHPIPPPHRVKRPYELMRPAQDEFDDEDPEDDEDATEDEAEFARLYFS